MPGRVNTTKSGQGAGGLFPAFFRPCRTSAAGCEGAGMRYNRTVKLKDGRECCLRNGTESDGQAVVDLWRLTHGQTDYLLSYPDEGSADAAQEGRLLRAKEESPNEIEMLAVVGGAVAGSAGVAAVGTKYKVRHRAVFGISVAREYWGLGIGTALLLACIECARAAGYVQLELNAVAENARALSMYEKAGFVEYGRNPKGFYSRLSGFQEVVHMRLEL